MFPLQIKINFSYLIYIAITICFAMSTIAQAEPKNLLEEEMTQPKTTSSSVNIEELTQFIDGYVESMINDFEPPGMMVSVVIGDKKITKGYGIFRRLPQSFLLRNEGVFTLRVHNHD